MISSLLQQNICQRKSPVEHKKKLSLSNRGININVLPASSVKMAKNTPLHRLYIVMQDKSILEWIAVLCTGLFVVLTLITYGFTFFVKERFSLAISFPRDTDLEEYLINYNHASTDVEEKLYTFITPLDTQEEKEYDPYPDRVKTLSTMEYTVKKGQTISEIALAFRLNVDTIISYNNIKSVRKIYPGMKILIPNTDGITYYVKKGDCLSGIAGKFGISLNNLLDWNNISSSVIHSGSVLFIPGARMSKYKLAEVMGTLFKYPASGGISSRYGWRIHPISRKRHFHNGIDITDSPGTPIRASRDGKILKIGYNQVYGKYIIIQHDNGFQTFYGHLRKETVGKGKIVHQGDKIGEMGNTGYSTGFHVHFSIYKNGETVDPLLYLKK
ncbi:MAG: M23 family metallopeptidase [Spirochaetales bacterium]|nr:M23 family metallopeptidase [Spirochaetales bacterium]